MARIKADMTTRHKAAMGSNLMAGNLDTMVRRPRRTTPADSNMGNNRLAATVDLQRKAVSTMVSKRRMDSSRATVRNSSKSDSYRYF